jgi:hypothetical protein
MRESVITPRISRVGMRIIASPINFLLLLLILVLGLIIRLCILCHVVLVLLRTDLSDERKHGELCEWMSDDS